MLVDAHAGGASLDDPLPSDHVDDPSTGLVTIEGHSASK